MTTTTPPTSAEATARPRPGATAGIIAAAGLAFAVYPIIRPYEDETTMAGAEAVASAAWIASHTSAMISFGLLAWGLIRLAAHLRGTASPARGPSRIAAVCMAAGTALVLPYYGAETFGLQAIAQETVRTGDLSLLDAFDTVRYGPVAVTSFLAGLLLIGAAGVCGARTITRLADQRTTDGRWAASAFGAAWVLLLPQFFAPPVLRMGHGLLVLVGCALAAIAIRRGLDREL